jgi:hypothetical protein
MTKKPAFTKSARYLRCYYEIIPLIMMIVYCIIS